MERDGSDMDQRGYGLPSWVVVSITVRFWCMPLARVRWTRRIMRWFLSIRRRVYILCRVSGLCSGCQCVSVSGAWSTAVYSVPDSV
ncbi:hypothetical protein V8F44DRAFT_163061 [Aspergillus fumigatus]